MCFHVVPIWSPPLPPRAAPRGSAGAGSSRAGQSQEQPRCRPGQATAARFPDPETSPLAGPLLVGWRGTGNLRPLQGARPGSQQIPAGDTVPGKVPAGLHPVEGLTSLLWRSARPQASSSHRGLIFICHWVICGGSTGPAARSGQHPYLAFALLSPAVGRGCGRLLPVLWHRWAPGARHPLCPPCQLLPGWQGLGQEGERLGPAHSHLCAEACRGCRQCCVAAPVPSCLRGSALLCCAVPIGPPAAPVTPRHPQHAGSSRDVLGQHGAPEPACPCISLQDLKHLAQKQGSSQHPRTSTVGTRDQRAPCLHPGAQSQHQQFQVGLPLVPCTHLGLTSQTSANTIYSFQVFHLRVFPHLLGSLPTPCNVPLVPPSNFKLN